MATLNPFDLLVDDSEDPAQLISAVSLEKVKKAAAPATGGTALQGKPAGKLPSRPVPPAQAVREAKTETGRGRGRGSYGSGRGGGRGGYERDSGNDGRRYGGNDGARTGGNDGGRFGGSDGFSGGRRPSEEVDGGRPYERRGGGGPRGPPRGGRQGGDLSNGDVAEGERPRRTYDRHSGSGRGNDFKRDGAGRGNWGTPADDVAPEAEEVAVEVEKTEKQIAEEEAEAARRAEEEAARRAEEEAEEKKMTLEEYQKVLEEKRKALLSEVAEERIVEVDKELKKMQQLSSKKTNDEIFIKLGSEKDKRPSEKEAKAKKSVSIQEYLKPADGERYAGGGRGRGRGGRGGARGGGSGGGAYAPAPKIEDPSQFPSLGGK